MLGKEPPEIIKNAISLTWLREHICTVPLEGALEREVEFVACGYILNYTLASVFFPDSTKSYVPLRRLSYIEDFDVYRLY